MLVDSNDNQNKIKKVFGKFLYNFGLYLFVITDIGIMVRVFARKPWFNPRLSHTKDSKNGT